MKNSIQALLLVFAVLVPLILLRYGLRSSRRKSKTIQMCSDLKKKHLEEKTELKMQIEELGKQLYKINKEKEDYVSYGQARFKKEVIDSMNTFIKTYKSDQTRRRLSLFTKKFKAYLNI